MWLIMCRKCARYDFPLVASRVKKTAKVEAVRGALNVAQFGETLTNGRKRLLRSRLMTSAPRAAFRHQVKLFQRGFCQRRDVRSARNLLAACGEDRLAAGLDQFLRRAGWTD
jgi:hypothetical protein